jgi:UDP-N-acetylmuramate--alanine ligase
VLLTEVYAAGEPPIAGADGCSLAQALRGAGRVDTVFVADVAGLPAAIAGVVRDGDVLVTLGAGSIGLVPRQLLSLAGGAA